MKCPLELFLENPFAPNSQMPQPPGQLHLDRMRYRVLPTHLMYSMSQTKHTPCLLPQCVFSSISDLYNSPTIQPNTHHKYGAILDSFLSFLPI